MALQTNVFHNGEWVTRTVQPGDLLKEATAPAPPKPPKRIPTSPTYGILTRTVIESPVFSWVLPVQLRSPKHNDVVFVGDNFVQVCELGHDVQLHDIARKQDFGSRIRNACVIGSPAHYADDSSPNGMKIEEDDVDMLAATPGGHLPPQFIALVLERGDLVFLYLEENAHDQWTFVSHSEKIPDARLRLPGYHLVVDPSSRFLALGCSETHFQIWTLLSINTLRSRQAQGLPFRPIDHSAIPKAVNGVIHKMVFLSPGADSEERVILALILIHQGRSRLHRYEWELGESVSTTLRERNAGWLLDPSFQMPLLMIPSTIRESFLLITETSEAFWATLKNGSLEAQGVEIEERDQTILHIGNTMPLWTAWSRPWRLPEYHVDKDTIWLAREDGILQFLEIEAADGISTQTILGEVRCKIDTAFACLYDRFADILITGGDSGPGAIWRAEPRKPPGHIGTIPNWSPTIDITATKPMASLAPDNRRQRSRGNLDGESCSKNDQLFACAGRGQTGSIAEFRYGFEARVGFDLDLEDPVQQCWTLRGPASSPNSELCLLLAYPDRSIIYMVDIDSLAVTETGPDEVPYDLSSTTLAAVEAQDGTIIQVTADVITIVDPLDGNDRLAGLPPTEAFTSIVSFENKEGGVTVCIGTRSGEVFTVALDPNNIQNFRGTCDKFGSAGAYVFPLSAEAEPASFLVCCDSNVFLVSSLATRGKPRFGKKHRVWATGVESFMSASPSVSAVSRMRRNLSQIAGKATLTLITPFAIHFAELQSLPKPVLRHLPVPGTPCKVMYYARLDALVVATLHDGCPALRFIDPVTGLDLSMPTDHGGNEVSFITGLGRPGSRILALTNWNYEKDGRTWGYLVVSVRNSDGQGQVLIITAAKDDSRVSEDGPCRIRFYTKLKRSGYADPVWSIATEAQGLLLCTGETIQYEILDLEQKKLRKVKEYQLSSAASWMEVVQDRLHVVTIRHSLEIVDFRSSPDSETMTRLYTDDRAKQSLHCIEGVDTTRQGRHQAVTLLSDYFCGLWGMWAPPESDRPFKPIFHAELQASVRRFIRARTRPPWSSSQQQSLYGRVPSSSDGADVLGLGIDGSLRHFTILDSDAWRLLRFIQNLAAVSTDICHPAASSAKMSDDLSDAMETDHDHDYDPEPKTLPVLNMQVDGDILQRCLDNRALEKLAESPKHADRLRKLLENLEGGRHTQELKGEMAGYLDLAYDVLEYYLSPVL
ncbi:hypothetical protein LQW54_005663 [Pestalotiopsis sp. IQ-011]